MDGTFTDFADRPPQELFINREISWLDFNQRVLEEAFNERHPLLERLRFLSISANNLDEFYMVRVAGIKAQVHQDVGVLADDGTTAGEQLAAISEAVATLLQEQERCWRVLHPLMRECGIGLITRDELNDADRSWLKDWFASRIFAVLTPIAIDPAHPFPFIYNKGVTVAFELNNPDMGRVMEALVPLPSGLQRFVRLPDRTEGTGPQVRFMLLEDIVVLFYHQLFPGMDLVSHGAFRLLRDSDLELDEEAEDLVRTFEVLLKRRRKGSVIRLSANAELSERMLASISHHLDVQNIDVQRFHRPLGLASLSEMIIKERADLLFTPYTARFPERIRQFGGDCMAAIAHKDIVVHHPYESFDVVVQFLRQAARDPNVLAIKQTLYRTSNNSPIVAALIDAAEAGKSVTAMVELKARFDEEANIRWAKELEQAGVHVIFGFLELKTHAKISIVVRREGEETRSYVHFGTGNYHPITAKIYTDLSYFTCDPALARDAAAMFNFMTGYARPIDLEKISISPDGIKNTILTLIDAEVAHAKAGRPAQIWFKANSLVDPEVVLALYRASQAGVEIDLIIRGMCAIRGGVPGLSENIQVKSVIGRFLEHSRIYCFGNGQRMPHRGALVFISSADLMPRNLHRRLETLVPLVNETVHMQVLDQIMVANLKDTLQSWEQQPDGSFVRVQPEPGDAFSCHEYFMNNPSLSGRGDALGEQPIPPRLSLPEDQ